MFYKTTLLKNAFSLICMHFVEGFSFGKQGKKVFSSERGKVL